MPKILTIIICTYNRNEILKLCLESIRAQTVDCDLYKVVVVNNYLDRGASAELNQLVELLPNSKLIEEAQMGLSYARNAGMNAANSEWIGFIDDDCVLPNDFVEKALINIRRERFDCFGGHIDNWWHFGKPQWLDDDYGTKPKISDEILELDSDQFNWGGNIFFNKSVLMKVGGFDESIGMKGLRIGYSAENRVQMKLRQLGYKIGYDPSLVVNHLVAKHKLNVIWHLKAAYAEGRDGRLVFQEQYRLTYMVKEVIRLPLIFLRSIFKWGTKKDYYWQNLILDIGKPKSRLTGKFSSLFN